jgi:hypothetical protein
MELLRLRSQTGIDRIHLDVSGKARKLPPIPYQPVVTFVLPERLSGQTQNPIALPRGVIKTWTGLGMTTKAWSW